MNRYVSKNIKKFLPRIHPSFSETAREYINYVAPDDDINYTIMGMLILEKFGLYFNHSDIEELWLHHLPIGTTFTHLRVTLDRTFTISGTVTDGSNGTCTTDGSTEANATTMHVGTKDDTSGKTDTTFEIVDAGSYGSGSNITIAYSSPSSAVSMSVGSPETAQMQLIYALSNSYTVGIVSPKIKVSFDVSTAVGGAVDAGGTCRMWPNEPTVTIALTD